MREAAMRSPCGMGGTLVGCHATPERTSCCLRLQHLGDFHLKCFIHREDDRRFGGLMIFASRPRLTNFGTRSLPVFRADAFQHFLVGRELAWPQRSQLGGHPAAEAQQEATRAFQAAEHYYGSALRLRLG